MVDGEGDIEVGIRVGQERRGVIFGLGSFVHMIEHDRGRMRVACLVSSIIAILVLNWYSCTIIKLSSSKNVKLLNSQTSPYSYHIYTHNLIPSPKTPFSLTNTPPFPHSTYTSSPHTSHSQNKATTPQAPLQTTRPRHKTAPSKSGSQTPQC